MYQQRPSSYYREVGRNENDKDFAYFSMYSSYIEPISPPHLYCISVIMPGISSQPDLKRLYVHISTEGLRRPIGRRAITIVDYPEVVAS